MHCILSSQPFISNFVDGRSNKRQRISVSTAGRFCLFSIQYNASLFSNIHTVAAFTVCETFICRYFTQHLLAIYIISLWCISFIFTLLIYLPEFVISSLCLIFLAAFLQQQNNKLCVCNMSNSSVDLEIDKLRV
jgi:hypothetical protein